MTKSMKAKALFIEEAVKQFGEPDRWGNFKWKTSFDKGERRIKIGKTSWRYERKIIDRWMRCGGDFYTSPNSVAKLHDITIVNSEASRCA